MRMPLAPSGASVGRGSTSSSTMAARSRQLTSGAMATFQSISGLSCPTTLCSTRRREMGKIVVVKPTGEYVHLPADKSLDLRLIYLAIGASTVERIKVRYEGRVRDAYLDEE